MDGWMDGWMGGCEQSVCVSGSPVGPRKSVASATTGRLTSKRTVLSYSAVIVVCAVVYALPSFAVGCASTLSWLAGWLAPVRPLPPLQLRVSFARTLRERDDIMGACSSDSTAQQHQHTYPQ